MQEGQYVVIIKSHRTEDIGEVVRVVCPDVWFGAVEVTPRPGSITRRNYLPQNLRPATDIEILRWRLTCEKVQ